MLVTSPDSIANRVNVACPIRPPMRSSSADFCMTIDSEKLCLGVDNASCAIWTWVPPAPTQPIKPRKMALLKNIIGDLVKLTGHLMHMVHLPLCGATGNCQTDHPPAMEHSPSMFGKRLIRHLLLLQPLRSYTNRGSSTSRRCLLMQLHRDGGSLRDPHAILHLSVKY